MRIIEFDWSISHLIGKKDFLIAFIGISLQDFGPSSVGIEDKREYYFSLFDMN